jgi:hypothetical protein
VVVVVCGGVRPSQGIRAGPRVSFKKKIFFFGGILFFEVYYFWRHIIYFQIFFVGGLNSAVAIADDADGVL